MQALDLNLASRPFKNNTLPWLGFGLAAVALAVLTTFNVRTFREHRILLEDLRTTVSDLEGQLASLDRREEAAQRGIEKFDLAELAIKSAKANEVIHWKAFSWTRLFNQLQEILPHDVQMTAIHPVFRGERSQRRDPRVAGRQPSVPVSVQGVAKDLEAFLELERALFRDPHFDRVEPEGIDTVENSRETIFQLSFHYDPNPRTAPPAPDAGSSEPSPPAEAEAGAPDEPEFEELVPDEADADGVEAEPSAPFDSVDEPQAGEGGSAPPQQAVDPERVVRRREPSAKDPAAGEAP